MFERFVGCIAASLLVWLSLLYLNSDGNSRLTYLAFYIDTYLAIIVFLLLFFVFIFPLVYLRLLLLQPEPAENSTALVEVNHTDNGWKPTTVGHLEGLKQELWKVEERSKHLRICERQVCRLYEENSAGLSLWLAERGLSILRDQCRNDSAAANGLSQAIERIYAGDVDHEILDYQERIAQLYTEKASTTGDRESWPVKSVHNRIEKEVRHCQRQITELEQWRKKVTAATAESPYESAWQNFLDIAKRTAAAPFVQATSRVEAALAGLEAKRYYEGLVTEQWRHGKITEQEAAFIRERIHDEFLGGVRSAHS